MSNALPWLPPGMLAQRYDIVELAVDQVLTIETDAVVATWIANAGSPPGSSWCACFAWNMWNASGETPLGDGACETWHENAIANGRFLHVAQAEPGDVILFGFGTPQSHADHCGIVARLATDGGVPYVYTVEGNSAAGGGPHGNGVYAHRWKINDPAIIGIASL